VIWSDANESKRSAAALLRDAATKLDRPGAQIGDIDDALADIAVARLALTGCRARVAMKSAQEYAAVDVKSLAAGEMRGGQSS
jgi:hypothetical protein